MFIYFDLGNVVLHFSHERMCRQVAEACGADEQRVHRVLFDTGLKERAEAGACSRDEFYATLCEQLRTTASRAAIENAMNDIFSVNIPLLPVLCHLQFAGYRLGLLSNICESHWRYIRGGRFEFLREIFDVYALSFEIGGVKPNPKVFAAAAKLAGVAPQEIFYTDDIAGHVAAAREAGFNAVQFTTTVALGDDLRRRGLRTSY